MTTHRPAPIAFRRLTEVSTEELCGLMNDPDVRQHLPLAQGHFGTEDCERFVAAKEQIWKEHGYGPWAFVLGDEFVGWGGLQPEGDDVDVGLVLRREHWGAGMGLYRRIVDHAFREVAAESVVVLLPPSRTRVAALRRFGFVLEEQVTSGGELFNRYRLSRSSWAERAEHC